MDQTLTLAGGRIAISALRSVRTNLIIRNGRLFFSRKTVGHGLVVDLSGFLVLPGLINAHDHLELNLFPRLGRGPFANASDWAAAVYRPDDSPLREHRSIPRSVRLLWGGIKNLLCGVTTVAHHNPYVADVFDAAFPVRVLRRYGWAHSLHFSPDWQQRFRETPAGMPFILHAAEGTDEASRSEVWQMEEAGALASNTVVVHGVALGLAEWNLLGRRGASLVWCPSSNLFTLGRTVAPEVFDSRLPLALGTDSAMTAEGDLIDELRVAGRFVSRPRLYELVTTEAARVLRLQSGAGRIAHGGVADLSVVADEGQTPAEALLVWRPAMVFVAGQLKLLGVRHRAIYPRSALSSFHAISVHGRGDWLLPYNVSSLAQKARSVIGRHLQLAGKAIAA